MHNIEIGDIFISSNDAYKVADIQTSRDFPDDPYLYVETLINGYGWREGRMSDGKRWGFTLFEANRWGFKHYKPEEL